MALFPGSRRRGRRAGFTIIELLVVLAILGVILGFGMPAIFNFIRRSEIEGTARQTASLLQLARLEAIKRSVPARVTADFTKREIFAFVDLGPIAGSPVYDPAVDQVLGRFNLPRNVFFQVQGDVPNTANALKNLTQTCAGCPSGWADFEGDGSFLFDCTPPPLPDPDSNSASFFFGDPRGNFLEVRIEALNAKAFGPMSFAAPRIEIRKWDPTKGYVAQGANNATWKWN